MIPSSARSRLDRAVLSLNGLAIGDGFGEMCFSSPDRVRELVAAGSLSPGPWIHTDDTEMAIAIVEILSTCGRIDSDRLAQRFAERYSMDPLRGYGRMTRIILEAIRDGGHWRAASRSAFGGAGSMGNGAAMRTGPLGAYYADDMDLLVREARQAAEITHSHPEGIAGAIAVAVAAACAHNSMSSDPTSAGKRIFKDVLQYTPDGLTRAGIQKASTLEADLPLSAASKILGCGYDVTAQDTVPFALWCAANNLSSFAEALISVVSVGGDCDTNGAIVGGIVALYGGWDSIPTEWRSAQEKITLTGDS